jgi:hypothetical protein
VCAQGGPSGVRGPMVALEVGRCPAGNARWCSTRPEKFWRAGVQADRDGSGRCAFDGPKARLESSDGSPTYGPKARLCRLARRPLGGSKGYLDVKSGKVAMRLPKAGKSINDVRRVRLRSAGERAVSHVSGSKEARAATAARNGSPRGPGVLTGHNVSGWCASDGPKARLESSDGSPTYGPKARV